MKHRDIFRVPARIERRKDGWFMILTLGTIEHSFAYGDEKPALVEPNVNLIIEYTVLELTEV